MQLSLGAALLLQLSAALGASLRSSDTAYGSAQLQRAQVEAEDRRYWAGQWDTLESELSRLLVAAEQVVGNATAVNSTASNATAAKAAVAAVVKEAANHTKHHHPSPLAGIKLNLNPKKATDLIPALAMLKALYEEGKQNIANLNERERQSKKFIEEKEAQHKAKLAQIEDKFKKHILSEEFHTNETRDETRSWTYWTHVRERQHRQFHTSLKIQHGTMQKEKEMIEMYEKTIAGTADKKEVVQELNKVGGGASVEVVFLQQAGVELEDYCRGALVEVRRQRSELQKGLSPPEVV